MKEIACVSGVELLMDYLEGVLPADVTPRSTHMWPDARAAPPSSRPTATPAYSARSDRRAAARDLETSLKAFLRAKTTAFKQL